MKDLKANLSFAWKYAKSQKLKLLLFIILNIIVTLIGVISPIVSAKIIVELTNNNILQIIYLSIIILILDVLENMIIYFTKKISHLVHRYTLKEAMIDLGENILEINNECLDKNGSGVFIQRMNTDINKITEVFSRILDLLAELVTNIGVFIAIFIVNKIVFVYVVVMSLIRYIIERNRANVRNEKDKELRKSREKISGFISEMIRGIRDIKLLNSQKSFIKELKEIIDDVYDKGYKMENISDQYRIFSWNMNSLIEFILIIILCYLMYKNKLVGATALILYNYSKRAHSMSLVVGDLLESLKDFNLSCNRVRDIIDGKNFEKEHFGNTRLKDIKGNFEFKNVYFSYNKEKPVLKDLSFKIKNNETIAIVGKSGSGKSTIFNLITKMYDVDMGSILIDGINVNDLDKNSIRENISVIRQDPYIFNMSIRDNLRLVKSNLKEEEMINACKIACFHDFVMTLKDGYDTIIGEGGVNLSGGEKQRLAIARGIIKNTKIILFDEATSALDNITQAKIQNAINNMKEDHTILIIAHRLSTIINSDKILFLNDGKIESQGTHDELMKNSIAYKELYERELKKD